MDVTIKGHQLRYYSRMRDIEVAAFLLNNVDLGELQEVSAPRIDMYWSFRGYSKDQAKRGRWRETSEPIDWRTDKPERRKPEELRDLLRSPYSMAHVLLPHWVAVVLGLLLSVGALANLPGLEQLDP